MMPSAFGRYQIRSEIGRGGMATVYHAYDPRFGREVAIKVLPREFLHDPQFRIRFEREAKLVAALEHAAIVPVYDFGEEEGQPYIVMRYMAGGSLEQRLQRGPLPIVKVVEIFSRLAPALDAAHQMGIIHRDLKPGNILFDKYDKAFLSDFGIARLTQEGIATITGTAIVGTPAYMSPEQVQGDKELDGRSDVYALGIILFQMLTGDIPYHAATPAKVMIMHLLEPVPQIRKVKSDLPPIFDDLVAVALAKNPEQRFQTASELATQLETIVHTSGLITSPSALTPAVAESPTPPLSAPMGQTPSPPVSPQEVVPSSLPIASPAETTPLASEAVTSATIPEVIPAPAEATAVEAPPPAVQPRELRHPPRLMLHLKKPPLWLVGGIVAGLIFLGALGLTGMMLIPKVFDQLQGTHPGRRVPLAGQVLPQAAEGSFYFTSNRDGKWEIYQMDVTGKSTRLTYTAGNAESRNAVPIAGGGLYFESNRDGKWEIYHLAVDGHVSRLTNTAGDGESLEPAPIEGGGLFFTSNRSGKYEIYQMSIEGTVSQVTHTPGNGNSRAAVALAHGGLYFCSDRDGKLEIYHMDTAGKTSRLTNTPGDAESWDPFPIADGELYFTSNRNGKTEIYRMTAEGLVTQITNTSGSGNSWGARALRSGGLYFTSDRDGKREIYRMDVHGMVIRITNSQGDGESMMAAPLP